MGTIRQPISLLALLAVLGAACALEPSAPTDSSEPEVARSEVSVAAPNTTLGWVEWHGAIDLKRAVVKQYGSSATLTHVGDHLYDWRAKVDGKLLSVDIKEAVREQYGSSHILAVRGAHRNDWVAVPYNTLKDAVVPVLLVSRDELFDIDGVRAAMSRYDAMVLRLQRYLYDEVGASFRAVRPIAFLSPRTNAEWTALSEATRDSEHRWDLLYAGIEDFELRAKNRTSYGVHPLISPHIGVAPEVWLGAASGSGYAMTAPKSNSVAVPSYPVPLDTREKNVLYGPGHELVHTFGIGHTCTAYPEVKGNGSCPSGKYLMETGAPDDAILHPDEIKKLRASRVFQK